MAKTELAVTTYENISVLECPCGHQWIEKAQLPMSINAFVARMKSWSVCPKCGRKKKVVLLMGKKYREALAKLEIETGGIA